MIPWNRLDISDPPTIGEAFPAKNLAGQWVVALAMAMNDLASLDGRIHETLENDDPDGQYFFRLLCGALREIWCLFDVATKNEEVAELLDGLAEEAREAYQELKALFVRPGPSEENPEPRSWAESNLKDVRNLTFHYPQVGGHELQAALSSCESVEAQLRHSGARPYVFADVVALHASFGDIDKKEERERFEEIVTKAKQILQALIPVVWSSLGTHLRGLGIDPGQLRAPENEVKAE